MDVSVTLYRMKALRNVLQKKMLASRLDETLIARNMKHCTVIYKNLLEIFRKIDTPVKIMMILSVVFVVQRIMGFVYLIHTVHLRNITAVLLDLFLTCFLLLLPGVLVTLTNREVKGIKIVILNQLLVCKGDATYPYLNEGIEDCLLYIEQRPFKFTVWKMFAVDIALVLSVIGLGITCSLIMVQFAHFYG